ncbi:MAG TPA: hypothetical protein VIL86_15710, partial [Tepidisphaeraceae bacterium]
SPYFAKRFGEKWGEYRIVFFAGYSCAVGLVMMLSLGLVFMSKSVFQARMSRGGRGECPRSSVFIRGFSFLGFPMLTIPAPFFRKPRSRRGGASTPPPAPPGVALVLTTAEYHSGMDVTLTFDRAIDISAFDPTQLTMVDHFPGKTYSGDSISLMDVNVARIFLVETGPYAGLAYQLTASADTGIVAVDDGGTWAGVTDLNLPFMG